MQTRESVVCNFRSFLMCEEGRLRVAVGWRGGAGRATRTEIIFLGGDCLCTA